MSSSSLRRPWKRAFVSTSLNEITNCIFGGLSPASITSRHDDWPLRRIIALVTTSLPYLNSASG